MKFLCPNCKAKYQISDEKIAGRTLKMDCRRCNHAIVIRGDRLTGSGAAARPQAPAAPAPRRPAAPPSSPAALDGWHAAIQDVPVGPLSRDELSKKMAAGAVNEASLVWREGLEDWRPLREVPELLAFLRETRKPKTAPRPPRPAAPRPPAPGARAGAPRRPAPPPAAPRPAAPRPAAPRPARPAARGGMVAGRGAAAAAALDGLSDFDQDDEPTRVGSAIDFEAVEREREAARREQSKPAALPPEPEPSAPSAAAPKPAAPAKPAAPPKKPAAPKPAAKPAVEPAAAKAATPEPPAEAEAPASSPGATPSPLSGPSDDDAFDPFSASQPPPAEEESDDKAAAAMPVPVAAPLATEGQLAVPAEEKKRGLPIGAWIAIAGAMAFGVALAVIVGQKLILTPEPQPVATTEPTPPPTAEPDDPLELPPEEPETPETPETPAEGDTPEEPSEETETETEPAAPASGSGQRAGSRRSHGGGARPASNDTETTPSRPTGGRGGSTLSAEAQARFDRAAGDSTSGMARVRERAGVLDERRSAGGGGLNADQIRAVVARERSGVQRCYESAARRTGQAPSTRLDVDITVGGSGTVTSARVRGTAFADLSTCVQRTVLRWRFPATGGVSQTSIPFVFSGRD